MFFLFPLIQACDWHICLISLTFQTKDITIYLAEIRDRSSEKIFLKVLIYFSDQPLSLSLSAPSVYHWRCLDYNYKCYLFILSYFSKLGDFFTDNIQSLSHSLKNKDLLIQIRSSRVSLRFIYKIWSIRIILPGEHFSPVGWLPVDSSTAGWLGSHCLSRRSYYFPLSLNILHPESSHQNNNISS